MALQVISSTYETDGKYYVEERLKELAEEHNFSYNLEFSSKMKTVLARVRHKLNGNDLVTFNINYVMQCVEHGEINALENTILHETAHVLAGRNHGHDNTWRRIFYNLGGNGRTHSSVPFYKKLVKVYVYECPHCHRQVKARGKYRKNYACSDCCKAYNNGKYSVDYKLELVDIRE